jgi:hypothetical protein
MEDVGPLTMAVIARIGPIGRDIAVIIRDELSPAARSRALAQFAREKIDEARAANRRALGKEPPHEVFVDGRRGASLESVRPDGVIVAEFDLISDLLGFVSELLWMHSPVKSGRYRRSHRIFADGAEVGVVADNTRALAAPGGRWTSRIRDAREWVFVSVVPYARRIERGWSRQAPDGVYQAVAALARRRYGNIAKVQFTYRGVTGLYESAGERGARPARANLRQPAIVITTA